MISVNRYATPYGRRMAPAALPVVVYGTRWCAASQMVRRFLDRAGIPYRYVDLEADPQAAARLAWVSGGAVRHPTVYVGGQVLVEPSLYELEWALARSRLL